MRGGCAASSFFQFLVGYGEHEKVDGVINSVLVHWQRLLPPPFPILASTALNTTRTHAWQAMFG